VQEIDKDIPIEQAGSLEKAYQDQFAEPRFQTELMGAFAALALILAVVGIYGINAYVVAQRGREIAVRTAMGARPGQIFGTVLGHGLKLAAIGVVLGLAGSFVAARLLRNVLVGITGQDPMILAGSTIILFAVSAIACFIPARRAVGIDPANALRED
jgi:putative ABC transport system permease protein